MKKSDLLRIIKEEIFIILNEQNEQQERTLKANIDSLLLTVSNLKLKIFSQPERPGDTRYDKYRTDIEAIAAALKMPPEKLKKMRSPTGKRKRKFITTEEHLQNMILNIGEIVKFGRSEFSTGFFGKDKKDFDAAFAAAMDSPEQVRNKTLQALQMQNPTRAQK